MSISAFGVSFWMRKVMYMSRKNIISSSVVEVRSGVPQGSLLGPFFCPSSNDLPNISNEATLYLFGDDLKLFHTNSSQLHKEIIHFEKWVSQNGMELAVEKCYITRFVDAFAPLTVFNVPVKKVDFRDLDVHIKSDWLFFLSPFVNKTIEV